MSKVMSESLEGTGIQGVDAFCGREIRHSSLLLGSGLTECQTAKVRYVIWTEKIGITQDLLKGLESLNKNSGWDGEVSWSLETLANGWGERAVCLWAQESVNAEEERRIPEKFRNLEDMVCQLGLSYDDVVIYLEESVDEAINLQAYWNKEDIFMRQKSCDGTVESWSGFDPHGLKPSFCGAQMINIQLTTRQLARGGKTILAFPTLYNGI
ncbi:MAG: hypothetical protein FWG14_00590 [Peptococcaceae bacterium]|nr:hypothetical protein [Peptococcaceae bacterium]